MEDTQTSTESFIEKAKEILDIDLVEQGQEAAQIRADMLYIALGLSKFAEQMSVEGEQQKGGLLYWKAENSLQHVGVYVYRNSRVEVCIRLGRPDNLYEDIPVAAALPLVLEALGKLFPTTV